MAQHQLHLMCSRFNVMGTESILYKISISIDLNIESVKGSIVHLFKSQYYEAMVSDTPAKLMLNA